MNYYERVQRSIDYIEMNLQNSIDLHDVSSKAYMSLASLYRLFFSMTGCAVKEYIRKRRISEAATFLVNSKSNILDISLMFCFDSQEAFTRAFKQNTGITPGAFRKKGAKYSFERVNVLEKFFDIQDSKLLEKYPDIRVIKELKPIRVAYYTHYSTEPENGAWKVLLKWIKKVGLDGENSKMRVFGFNNPSPSIDFVPGVTEYGYEFMVTIDDDMVVEDELVKAKVFEGGRYAVMGISDVDGNGIINAWERFNKWIAESKYMAGNHQWLEEHLSFGDENSDGMKIDLYMPISEEDKSEFESKISIKSLKPKRVAYYRAYGENPWNTAWEIMLEWAKKNGYFEKKQEKHFINYNSIPQVYPGNEKFWFEVCMEIEDEEVIDQNVRVKELEGGLYACIETDRENVDGMWESLQKWMFANGKYTYSKTHQWFQEQYLTEPVCFWSLPPSYPAKCCMAVKKLKD